MILKGGKPDKTEQSKYCFASRTVTLKMNQKALLVRILLEPETVEKRCGGREKALSKGSKRKVLQLSLLLPPGFCSGQQHVWWMEHGAWSRIVAFIKYIFSFLANIFLIYIIYIEDRAIILWQRVLSLLTLNQVQKSLRAWDLETNSSVLCFRSLLCFQWDDLLEEAVVQLGMGCGGCWSCRNTQV